MDDKIALQQIKDITITITDKQGNISSIIVTSEELIERIKSPRYQTLTHAVSHGVSNIITMFSLEAVKDHAAIKFIKTKKIRQDISYSSTQHWSKKYWYFEIDKERFEFPTEQEGNYILEHVKHINNKLSFK